MSIDKWLRENTSSLKGKKVAITGSTGGLGREICRYLASLEADLCLMDRNHERSLEHKQALISEFPSVCVTLISVDLEDIDSVRSATRALIEQGVDIFIHNAGAYSIPRHRCSTGFDNVFQINFVSPYYMIRSLLPHLCKRSGKVIAVGSIAHDYSKADPKDIDFSTRKAASKVYGNAKRYLMFSLYELFKDRNDVKLAIAHPGITLTNITAHYPKPIFAIIKHPMKLIFMPPRRAALCIIRGVFEDCGYLNWIGPRIFDIWGMPKNKRLKTSTAQEREHIAVISDDIYLKIKPLEFIDN